MAITAGDSDAFLVEMVDAPPAHLLFKIESFSKLPKHHESMAFTAGDCKWKLSLSPKSSGGDRMYLSLSLAQFQPQFQAQFHAMPSGLQVDATCSIFLYNTTLDKYLCFRGNKRIFNMYNPRWGFSISKKMLLEPSNGFLVDDRCIFGAEVLSSTPVKSIQCSSFLEWEIPHSTRSQGAWTSDKFLLGGLYWRMKISGGERVVICLELTDSYEKVEADIRIRLTKKPASTAFGSAASHCFTPDKDVCAIACPKAFADVFKPGKDGCFLATDITVKEFSLETREASPSHLLTKIKSFSKLSKHGISKLESAEFEAGDYKWEVIIYPDGDEVGKKANHISVHLSIVGTCSLPAGWEVNAIFNFFLYDHIKDNYLCFRGKAQRFQAVNPEVRLSKFMDKPALLEPSKGYVFEDDCVFGAEVFVTKNQRYVERINVMDVEDPYEHQWEISDFSKLEKVWYSEEFFAGGYNWSKVVYMFLS